MSNSFNSDTNAAAGAASASSDACIESRTCTVQASDNMTKRFWKNQQMLTPGKKQETKDRKTVKQQ